MITVIDSGISNLGSVASGLRRVGAEFEITSEPERVDGASALILPGVGAFGDGMESLARAGLVEPIRSAAGHGVPILGICLGMQLLADRSEEFGEHEGLGLVPGRVVRLPAVAGVRIPNIGWCDVDETERGRLFDGVPAGGSFYFVHSYYMECQDPSHCVGTIGVPGHRFGVAIERGNVFGAQFHPEKSQDLGLAYLANFVAHASE